MRVAEQIRGIIFVIILGAFFPVQGFSVGQIFIYVSDSSSAGAAPPSAQAYLNITTSQAAGTNELIVFSNVEAGMHTVEVNTPAPGYLIRQSPSDPNAVNDPDSEYGNPRNIEVIDEQTIQEVFQFDPVITASAVVRDAWTMERLEDAAIEFILLDPGGNFSITKYPWFATYATNWVSDTEGIFPVETILYLGDYDLNITYSGYEQLSSNNIIINASAGDEIDLGTLFLYPVDANSNQIADAWEALYFESGSNVVVDADVDADGMNNRDEYIAGTDPTNWHSHLWLELISGSNTFNLAWYTEPDRTYIVGGTTNLLSDTWVQVGGPWEATNGQIEIYWAETNHNLSWHNSYRVEVVPNWWQGTNQVLVRTNDWPIRSGSGTNSWGGGVPPLP
ncbi:MAG: hypothetical protein V3V05_01035 [Pontiella sp.]